MKNLTLSAQKNFYECLEKLPFLKSLSLDFCEYFHFKKRGLLILRSCSTINDRSLRKLGKCLKNLGSLQSLSLNYSTYKQPLHSKTFLANRCGTLNDEGLDSLSEGLECLTSLQDLALVLPRLSIRKFIY